MKRFKKQFLGAALVVALGAAVYLNWSLTAPKPVSKTLGESKYVNATVATTAAKQTSNSKSKPDVLSTKQKQYFASAKTTRDTTQDKVIDKASEVLKLDSSSKSDKTKAQSNVAAVIKNFTLQDTIESTLKAKGFSNCLSYINDDGCTVTVLKDELKKLKPVLVKSTVQSVANISFDKITIVTI
jgi:stage III sporulation protein AH